MPKLWSETVQTHRQQVRDAILDAAEGLVSTRGLMAVTMSHLAEVSGIGRATIYKYFPDAESVLLAWHQRLAARHLDALTALAATSAPPADRLRALLTGYAASCQRRGGQGDDANHADPSGSELPRLLHRDEQVGELEQRLHTIVAETVREAVAAGRVRDDIPAGELAGYCLHALGAAVSVRTTAALNRLVSLVLSSLAPPPGTAASTRTKRR